MARNETKTTKTKGRDKVSLLIFLLVFAISCTGMTMLRSRSAKGTISGGMSIFNTNELGERLVDDMTPITVDENSPFYKAFKDQDRINVLLLGIADGNTDTIMVGSYDMSSQKVSIISIPRDTYHYRAGFTSYGAYKINSIYRTSNKSVVPVAETVSEILYGMPIHCYALVTYEDIRQVMQAIGGVEMYIPFHMKYDDPTKGHELHIDIPAGNQIIDSSNVEEFLRFRKGVYGSYVNGDIGRTEMQREFVQKVIEKCLSEGNLKEVAKAVLSTVESDLSLSNAIKIASKASGLSMENVKLYQLPGTDKTMYELSFWVQDDEGIYRMLEEIYGIDQSSEEEGSQAPANP
ncbi:MAG: LCP family protein [Firmicutes bacterium]|nr:LCP family protein [Bacillota bacterium]